LESAVKRNHSKLCIGLDFDPQRVPENYVNDPLGFNRMVIDATADLVCAYKPNSAFYEVLGAEGITALKDTIASVPKEIPVILDAKRGDIGNTSRQYARAVFEYFGADGVTVAPYMGKDSVSPFLDYKSKGVFVLCLTSNPGAADFQRLKTQDSYLYLEVAKKCVEWSAINPNIGLVTGATQQELPAIRAVSRLPLLIPGVGAQGGDLKQAVKVGNTNGLAIINTSRSVLYPPKGPGSDKDRIRKEAQILQAKINEAHS